MRTLAVAVAVAVVVAVGCGSSDDERTVAGRSSSQAAAVTSVELAARVERTRTRDAATGQVAGAVRVTARASGLGRATLRAPSGAEAPLGPSDGEEAALEVDDAGPLGGPGQYAVLAALAGGGTVSSVVVVGDAFPEAPAITAPADGARDVSLQPTVVWSGGAARVDVRVVEVATGRAVHAVSDVLDTAWRLPPGALAAHARYRLEVHACDVPAGSPARLAAGTSVTFETGAAP